MTDNDDHLIVNPIAFKKLGFDTNFDWHKFAFFRELIISVWLIFVSNIKSPH